MSETENLKVYELAKELGIDSISLLDKIKGLGIQVKNHMSELQPGEVETTRQSFLAPRDEKPKATTARKRAASTTAAAKAPTEGAAKAAPATKSAAAKSTTAKATTTKKTTRKKATDDSALAAAVDAANAKATGGGAASPIIRRRTKADGATETVATGLSKGPIETPADEVQMTEEAMMSEAEAAPTEEMAMEEDTTSETGGATAAASTSSSTTPTAGEPYVPTARPVAPRRSFLKIVEAQAPAPRPVIKAAPTSGPKVQPRASITPGATDRDGFRVIKMTKENLDQMVEEEAAKKRGGGPGGGREGTIRPEDVRFADYRKKEMVFLPKRKKLPVGKTLAKTKLTTKGAKKRVIDMGDTIAIQDFASQLQVKANEVIRKLMGMGIMANLNSSIDFDTASVLGSEYEHEVRNVAFKEADKLGSVVDAEEELVSRPPIVTIMGHVDHGKTTLLDSIREANVAAGEAGGITQHIGAYTIEKEGKLITFIDTPGHEAFSVMRARGANVTDIVILVVSADDGVMPQTREALSHAQAAGVPIIVAVNKIDKPGANPEKIKQGLSELNLLAEDWGGDTMFIPVSALKKTNLDKLLEAILLQAEVLDLKANPKAFASGTVLEARLEKGRGPMVSVLIERGTLKAGDPVVSGSFSGKVRAMMDDKGKTVKEAGPAYAVEILGFEGVPNAGDPFNATATEADAREIVQNRIDAARAKASQPAGKVSLEELFSKVKAGDVKELNVVIKGDVFGSVEAIKDSLLKTSTDKVKIKVLHAAAGGITESDVLLASASGAIIIGFNVRPETKARQVAEAEHVQIKSYSIIYELIDDIKKAMEGMLEKKAVERFLGRAEVRQVFSVPKIGTIAGTAVVDGKIVRGANVRLLRDSRIIFEGKMSSLKRFKDDAKEVAQGFECGVGIENYNDVKPGDIIEAYQIDMIAGTL